ncbi:MAG: M28 family peptidase [Acidobacteria bacterium]|nr:M28 family peptidase [Acidobacteriota bacterium]
MQKAWTRSLLLAAAALAAAEESPKLPALVDQLRRQVQPARAMDRMRRVYSTDRWFTFSKFQETAGYLQRTLAEAGLRDAELIQAPADGVTQFGYWTMPMAWDVKQARLEIAEPGAPEEFRVLADYQKTPASLGMWSGPTPPSGIVAEVVELKDENPATIEKLDLKGKLVLTRQNPANIKWALAKQGALGAINTFTENPELRDGRQWINSWGDNGWAFTRASTPMLSFSITPRQAEFVRRRLAWRGSLRVKAQVDSRLYAGSYPYVTALIPGTTGEEVLLLGHTSEQGAHDNATGVAAILEAASTIQALVASGKLPRPRRGIRVLLMGEMYASMHYVAKNPERIRRTVAAMCLDTPAGFYNLAGTEYTFHMNPHVAKSYTDAFVLKLAEAYFPMVKRPWHWQEYRSGTDTYLSEPMIGVPTVWPYSGTGVHTHHNSEDKPETVDERSLRDLAVVGASYAYYLAAAGEREADWLAEITLNRGYEQVLHAAAVALDRGEGPERIAYAVDRETAALASIRRLDGRDRPKQMERLRRFGDEQIARLGRTAAPSAADREASGIVVKRKRTGTIPLDEIRPDQREGYPSGAWAAEPITALYWCDGRRNLAEVIRLTRLELGARTEFDFVGYFKFLQRRGYVGFVK